MRIKSKDLIAILGGILLFIAFKMISALGLHSPMLIPLSFGVPFIYTIACLIFSNRDYKLIEVSSIVSMVLSWGYIIFDSILTCIESSIESSSFYFTVNNIEGLCAALFAAVPLIVTIAYRTFQRVSDTPEYAAQRQNFKTFFRHCSIWLMSIYIIFIFMNLVLARTSSTGIFQEPNFIPMKMIFEEYIPGFSHPDPGMHNLTFMLLFGNLLLLTPIGFYCRIFFPKVHWIFLFIIPAVLSGTIEISQLLLKNGHCDIDDFILNVLGFFLGFLIKILLDKVRFKISKTAEGSIF